MMSRRGQLKGIDLDSYSKTHSPKDKMTDFMFLAVSLILLLFSAPLIDRGSQRGLGRADRERRAAARQAVCSLAVR